MSRSVLSRGALRRLFGKLALASVGVAVASPAAAGPGGAAADRDVDDGGDDDVDAALAIAAGDDGAASAHAFAILLDHMQPIDATRAVTLAALSPDVGVRAAVGEALTWCFPLLGARSVIDHLSRDPEPRVRLAAARAAHARRIAHDAPEVLQRLAADPEPSVAEAARLALLGR